ncbi:Proteasome subunit alpha type-2, partial [Galemys pyrenaicus]
VAEHGYSFLLTTFSLSSKLIQTEYTLAAVAEGVPSGGIKAANGVVLTTEKKQKSFCMMSEVYTTWNQLSSILQSACAYNPKTSSAIPSGLPRTHSHNSAGIESSFCDARTHSVSHLTIKESFKMQMTENNVDVGICNEAGFRRLTPTKIKDYLAVTG